MDGDVSLPFASSDTSKCYVEVVTYDRENDKEESIGRGKVNLKEEKLVDKGHFEIGEFPFHTGSLDNLAV